jgi:hypothetical protein
VAKENLVTWNEPGAIFVNDPKSRASFTVLHERKYELIWDFSGSMDTIVLQK